jgi:predicted SnoaL-like aldol condensation-catalyzing enzyme
MQDPAWRVTISRLAWIAADSVRFEDGKLAEHWDVLEDEATEAESVSGLPMFGDRFPA